MDSRRPLRLSKNEMVADWHRGRSEGRDKWGHLGYTLGAKLTRFADELWMWGMKFVGLGLGQLGGWWCHRQRWGENQVWPRGGRESDFALETRSSRCQLESMWIGLFLFQDFLILIFQNHKMFKSMIFSVLSSPFFISIAPISEPFHVSSSPPKLSTFLELVSLSTLFCSISQCHFWASIKISKIFFETMRSTLHFNLTEVSAVWMPC